MNNQRRRNRRINVSTDEQREINRVRARERRQAMTPEEREAYLARRRQAYRLRRERLQNASLSTNLDGITNENLDGTTNENLDDMHQPNEELFTISQVNNHQTNLNQSEEIEMMVIETINSNATNEHINEEYHHYRQERNRQRQREQRETMSTEEREHYLAHRRNSYHQRRQIMENDNDMQRHQGVRIHIRTHNVAKNFKDHIDFRRHSLQRPKFCPHCSAKLFEHETYSLCCEKGRTILPSLQSPTELFNLYINTSNDGVHFRRKIRSYNHAFSFTSIGVHIDENLANGRAGVYTFRAQGSIYHNIGGLVPQEGYRPRFLQLYVYDTDHEIENRLAENEELDRRILEKIQHILDENNNFARNFRRVSQLPNIHDCRFIIKEQPLQRQYALPSASQVAGIVVGDEKSIINGRDIVVQTVSGQLMRVPETHGCYDPLQYPLLLPYGNNGWDLNSRNENGTPVTCREYYAYLLQSQQESTSLLLLGGRLLQQYIVDNYVKIESSRMRWFREKQHHIRSELYVGLQDALNAGENNAGNIGRRTVLPASFNGSPRNMYQRYQDAMALVQKFGKPDLFITMTCNPSWDEITSELLYGQSAQDRPDLTTRIFRAKYEQLKDDIYSKQVLGLVAAHVHVIEFQKRGLPHAHILIILDEQDKLHSPDDYDAIVRAEIPDRDEEPELYTTVIKWMLHGPCGRHRPSSPCMKDGKCKKNYPKQFSPTTLQGNDSYPIYRRRDNGRSIALDNDHDFVVDNRWVVPYNPWLLKKYDCHINVEVCSSIKSVKYLYKYVYKGPDRVAVEIRPGSEYDEIQKFIDARWICPQEAFWRIFEFSLHTIYPSIQRLQIHLPNRQQVTYHSNQTVSDILLDESLSTSMLIEFFNTNSQDPEARQLLYREFPEKYRWVIDIKKWRRRTSSKKVIGRIYSVSPSEGERYYLRILLNHVKGPTSFDYLLTVDGIKYPTFQKTAEKIGLLEEDQSIRACLQEASATRMPSSLRRLFATILVYCTPTGIRKLWDEFFYYMIEDYSSSSVTCRVVLENRLLKDLNVLLMNHYKKVSDYDLPTIRDDIDDRSLISRLINEQYSIITPKENLTFASKLNESQLHAYTTIMNAVNNKESRIYFIDGPGGTGKTFLYRAILATLRQEGLIALATATSGIAATILPGGRTAHSRFKIPINTTSESMCTISKQSELADLLRQASILIWDEATMTHRYAFEALDRSLKDIIGNSLPFGGKILIIGGDFRQVLPVVQHGTIAETIDACIVKSPLWNHVEVIQLTQNMRAKEDSFYSNFLLRVGDGNEPHIGDDLIRIPNEMVVPWEDECSITTLINTIFPTLHENAFQKEYIVARALITPLNECVDKLNNQVINLFPGELHTYYSFDFVENDTRNLYQLEYLNSIAPGGLPPHKLVLKKGAPIMLLRNLDPMNGLCNGTRLICREFYRNLIDAEIATGQFAGDRVFLPRIPMKPSEDIRLPFTLFRKQFPIRLSFALTINKAQGQTIPHIGIYLPQHVFGHGQLYVALSRGVSMSNTKVLIKDGKVHGKSGTYTKNVVYRDVLISTKRQSS